MEKIICYYCSKRTKVKLLRYGKDWLASCEHCGRIIKKTEEAPSSAKEYFPT